MSGGRGTTAAICLLVLFALVIRVLPGLVRPAAAPDDCAAAAEPAALSVPAMERCLAVHPTDIELMLDLAVAYERAEQPDRARGLYTRALAIDPRDGEVRAMLARLPAAAAAP